MTRWCVGAAGGGEGVDGGEENVCGAPQILVSIKECSGVHQSAMDQTLLAIRTNIYISTLEAQYRTPRETDVIYSSASMLSFPSDPTAAGSQFTCFTGTKVQILTGNLVKESSLLSGNRRARTGPPRRGERFSQQHRGLVSSIEG